MSKQYWQTVLPWIAAYAVAVVVGFVIDLPRVPEGFVYGALLGWYTRDIP